MTRYCGHCEWGTTLAGVRVIYSPPSGEWSPSYPRVSYVCARHVDAELEELRYLGFVPKVG